MSGRLPDLETIRARQDKEAREKGIAAERKKLVKRYKDLKDKFIRVALADEELKNNSSVDFDRQKLEKLTEEVDWLKQNYAGRDFKNARRALIEGLLHPEKISSNLNESWDVNREVFVNYISRVRKEFNYNDNLIYILRDTIFHGRFILAELLIAAGVEIDPTVIKFVDESLENLKKQFQRLRPTQFELQEKDIERMIELEAAQAFLKRHFKTKKEIEVLTKKRDLLIENAVGITSDTLEAYAFVRQCFVNYSKANAKIVPLAKVARFFAGQLHNHYGDVIVPLLLKPEYATFNEAKLESFFAELKDVVDPGSINRKGDVHAILTVAKELTGVDFYSVRKIEPGFSGL